MSTGLPAVVTRTELHICEDDFRLLDMVERHVTLQLTFPKALVLPDLASQPSRSRLVTRRTISACRTWSKRLVPLQMTFSGTFVSPDAPSQTSRSVLRGTPDLRGQFPPAGSSQ